MRPLDYVEARRAEILDELIAFASIPSVSTDPAYAKHIAEAAAWVAERMRRAGLEHVTINPTEASANGTSHQVGWTNSSDSARTVLKSVMKVADMIS